MKAETEYSEEQAIQRTQIAENMVLQILGMKCIIGQEHFRRRSIQRYWGHIQTTLQLKKR